MATTYNNLYLDARKRLKEAGIESAQLEAREIVCYAAGKTREQLFPGAWRCMPPIRWRSGCARYWSAVWRESRWLISSENGSSMD